MSQFGTGGVSSVAKTGSALLSGDITLTGTANQVTLTQTAQDITFSLPQSIATGSSPTFTGLTLSGLTSGSVLFAGTSGVISQDNANFFWDDTNNRLGIGTASPGAHLEIMSLSAANVGMMIQAASSQSGNLTEWQDSSAAILTKVNFDGTIGYGLVGGALGSISFFTGNGSYTAAGSAPRFFSSSHTIAYTSSPAFGLPPFFFAFQTAFKAQTAAVTMFQPIAYYAGHSHTADGVVWTGGDAGGVATFADTPSFSIANGGSFTTWSYTAFRTNMTINTGAALATRKGFYFQDATGAGTLTDQIAIDIASLSKGGTSNIAIRTGANGVLEIGNKFTKYNNIATVSNGVPSELATVDLTAQGAAIAATTIYAVPASGVGMYRVSWVATVTRAATTSSVLGGATGFQLTYTDGDDSVVKTSAPTTVTAYTSAGNATGTQVSGVFVAYCKASTNLQYAFGYTSVGGTTMQFNLHVKVEAL